MEILDGKAECQLCSKWFKVNADGTIRSHNCSGITEVSLGESTSPQTLPSDGAATARKSRQPRGSKAPKQAPANVRKLGSALIATGAETASRAVIARAVPMDFGAIPPAVTDIPDADKMVGPFIDLLWPSLPAPVRKLALQLADHEDIIVALEMWWDYISEIRKFTAEMHAVEVARKKQGNLSPVSNVSPIERAVGYVAPQAPTEGFGIPAGLTPFEPVADGTEVR